MSQLQQYAIAAIYVNGKLLAEEASVTISRDTKAQVVETVAKGFAGVSPGAAMMTIDVENAVPSADFELNPDNFWSNNGFPTLVETAIFVGQLRVLTTKGFIMKDDFSHSTSSPSKIKFTINAQFAPYR